MEAEKFVYSPSTKVIRKKSLSSNQKAMMLAVIILASMISILGIVQNSQADSSAWALVAYAILPEIIALAFLIYAAVHPAGPEKDFVLPAVDSDPSDMSIVSGNILSVHRSVHRVEVLVPNVHSINSSLLGDGNSPSISQDLAYAEMVEMATECISGKFPNFEWQGDPQVQKYAS